MNNLNTTTPIKDEMPQFYQCLCPIWLSENGRPDLIGSGTLIKVDQTRFLITAAHVIDNAMNQPLLVGNLKGFRQIGGVGKLTLPISGSRQDDRNDISVIVLDEDTVSFIENLYAPLPIHCLDANDAFYRGKTYEFVGFPWRKVHRNGNAFEPPIYYFKSASIAETDYSSLRLSPLKHIAVEFDLKHAIDIKTGRDVMAPKPAGMSGGAVWSFIPVDLDGQQMLTRRLVGIAIEYISSRHVLVGVRINAALECIRMMFPSLTASIPAKRDVTIICNGHFHE